MALPNVDPSLPSNVSPIFGDVDAARGDQMRANNNLIWGNLTYLLGQITNIVSTILGGRSAGNASGNIAVNNGTKNVDLNADKLDDLHAGNASGNIAVNNGTKNVDLNADLLDGLHAGNASGNISVNNGVENINGWMQIASKLNCPIITTGSVYDILVANKGGRVFLNNANAVITNLPVGFPTYTFSDVILGAEGDSTKTRFFSATQNDSTTWDAAITSYWGDGVTWVKTRNADGSVPEAAHITSPSFLQGTYTSAQIYSALTAFIPSGSSIGIRGTIYTNAGAVAYHISSGVYDTSTSILLRCLQLQVNAGELEAAAINVSVTPTDTTSYVVSISW